MKIAALDYDSYKKQNPGTSLSKPEYEKKYNIGAGGSAAPKPAGATNAPPKPAAPKPTAPKPGEAPKKPEAPKAPAQAAPKPDAPTTEPQQAEKPSLPPVNPQKADKNKGFSALVDFVKGKKMTNSHDVSTLIRHLGYDEKEFSDHVIDDIGKDTKFSDVQHFENIGTIPKGYVAEKLKSQLSKTKLPKSWTPQKDKRDGTAAVHFESPEQGTLSMMANPETGQFEVKHNGGFAGLKGVKGIFPSAMEAMNHAKAFTEALDAGTVAGNRPKNVPSGAEGGKFASVIGLLERRLKVKVAGALDGLTKQKAKTVIYNLIEHHTKGFFTDEYWKPIGDITKALDHAGIPVHLVEAKYQHESGKTSPRGKEWTYQIPFDETGGFWLHIVASFGPSSVDTKTQEHKSDKYDLTFQLEWTAKAKKSA